MPTSPHKPLLPSHYSVWFEPPDDRGDEVLHIVSERRSLKLKGRSFREFHQSVVPLLDGKHSVEEIENETADLFPPGELRDALNLLADQGILVDAARNAQTDGGARLAPQINLFHDLAPGIEYQAKLRQATVAVVGLGGAGAAVALSLASSGVGTLNCIDALPVTAADVYLAPFLGLRAVGHSRAATTAQLIQDAAPELKTVINDDRMDSEEDLQRAIAGSDLIVCCLNSSQSNLIFKLNRVSLSQRLRWIACTLAGAEIVVGPAIHPGTGPCYLCYRMRAVACAGNPEDAFAYERYLDRRKKDETERHENLVFGAGIAANVLGLEVLKEITGISEPSLVGRILTIRLTDLTMEKHLVLRKPWCPACFGVGESAFAR